MKTTWHPEGRLELAEVIEYYAHASARLAEEFAADFEKTLGYITRSPLTWPRIGRRGRVRRCLFEQFPYSIVYQPSDGEIRIYAIAHQSRRTGYWRKRPRPSP